MPEEAFIARLQGVGLTEKEARCYFYLLKYGPKTPSPLAKALHTYREDVHRTLTALIEKGMVRPSLDSPTVYAAVELEAALESALKKHETELREMERRKRELEELSRQQRFRPSDEVATFKVLKNLKEIASVAIPTILSAEQEFLWIAPKQGLAFSSMFGINEVVEKLTARGGQTRETLWQQAIPAEERIRQLLQQGSPQA